MPNHTVGPHSGPQVAGSLTDQPFGLLLAALFGLSPGLFVDRLQSQAERYKDGLRNSEVS